MHAVEQRLPLLSICVALPQNRDAAMRDLQNRIVSLQGDSAEAAVQLGRLKAVADKLQQHTPTSMDISDMQRLLVEIHNKTHEMDSMDEEKVLEACVAMHRTLGVQVADQLQETSRQVLVALDDIREAQEAALNNQGMMMACMERLETYMEQFISRSDMRSDRHRQVCFVAHSQSRPTCAAFAALEGMPYILHRMDCVGINHGL